MTATELAKQHLKSTWPEVDPGTIEKIRFIEHDKMKNTEPEKWAVSFVVSNDEMRVIAISRLPVFELVYDLYVEKR